MAEDVIEGQATEMAVAVIAERGLARADTPQSMIALATELAGALKDIVERQKLYTVIQGKKYPQVEAWATIGRMDNVVAREAVGGIVEHDDGSYEAMVELLRLSDGMIIGRASALCGTPDDKPWSSRAKPARRSMAVTRATSRAFRQQYSWIMALAGYQPTPVEEMPHEGRSEPEPTAVHPAAKVETETLVGETSRTGKIARGGDSQGYGYRQGPDGHALKFRLEIPGKDDQGNAKSIPQVIAEADIAEPMWAAGVDDEKLLGRKATCTGRVYRVTFPEHTTFYRMKLTHLVIAGLDGQPDIIVPPATVSPLRAVEALPADEKADLDALEVPWPELAPA